MKAHIEKKFWTKGVGWLSDGAVASHHKYKVFLKPERKPAVDSMLLSHGANKSCFQTKANHGAAPKREKLPARSRATGSQP